MFLYEQIEQAKTFGVYRSLPNYIVENLNPALPLRPYQSAAFQNFITYFETPALCQKPAQTLFHMATGSGKTLIMAGLMLYLYQRGYRNFLFFVNLSNIVQKTKDNFLTASSAKYLFADEIVIDGERVPIREVQNFQSCEENAINICFTTTQGLHSRMWLTRENGVSIEDFDGVKTVLISDEAHHLNVDTRGKMSREEEESYHSWEETVRRIFERNDQNVLLEFTATCDLDNSLIRAAYERKIVFDYPLKRFRSDLYSKEILSLRSDLSVMDRTLQALMLSQYRLKIFEDHRLAIKPVVLLKAAKVADSKAFMQEFIETVHTLTGAALERISTEIDNPTMKKAYAYFKKRGITFDQLAQELKEDFSAEHCISANDDSETEKKQLLLNSLEDADNPYRAVFEVKKLDEGWDVLNLFDIVRLYETRQSSGKRISQATISEAQLIGRGARYCPFQVDDEQPRYQRKYDNDIDNELRICEELYYHCQNDHRYIAELHQALREIGVDPDKVVTRRYVLKEAFKQDSIYKEGVIFINDRVISGSANVEGLLPSVRAKRHVLTLATGASGEDVVMEVGEKESDGKQPDIHLFQTTIGEIAEINYAIVNKGLAAYPVFKFKTLKSYFPNLKSTRQFITGENYLKDIHIDIRSQYEVPPVSVLNTAVRIVLRDIAGSVLDIDETYEGTRKFRAKNVCDVFSDKTVNYTDPPAGGAGISQADVSVDPRDRLDLSKEDWFAFTDNYGTSEEKAFVAYFKNFVPKLKKKYKKVYLVRNERQFHLYSFQGGERFEPDYVLFLQKGKKILQIFIEPKGSHLIAGDQWKEDFMLQMKAEAIPVKVFADDNKYLIWGFHFFNTELRSAEFDADMCGITERAFGD